MSAPNIPLQVPAYPSPALFIDGDWISEEGRLTESVLDPSSGRILAALPCANSQDMDCALAAAERAFGDWRKVPAIERSRILREAARALREDEVAIALNLTSDQGKPYEEALIEVRASAEHIEWHAEECRRLYGRTIPSRAGLIDQRVVREPIGVCAAFTPWNFPLSQAARKVAAALGAGCTIILKGPENTPSAVIALARAFEKSGLPKGALNLLWGVPSTVSSYLLASPVVRGVSFTGSVPVGKHLAALAGERMLRATFELGGHAPAIVFDDADVEGAVRVLVASKFRNAGQVCVAPSRFFVHEKVYEEFVTRFTDAVSRIEVGRGLTEGVQMGPLAHARRVDVMTAFVDDAVALGASIAVGGHRTHSKGNFFAPTVLLDVPDSARVMQDEPFGPVAPISRWSDLSQVLQRANSLPYGLAGFAFTRSSYNANVVAEELNVGQLGINHFGVALAELPMGGFKESGYGSEGGLETFDGYLQTKTISHRMLP